MAIEHLTHLHHRYNSLRTELDRLTSGIAALICVLKHDEPCIALDLAHLLESHGCEALDSHPAHKTDCAEIEGGDA